MTRAVEFALRVLAGPHPEYTARSRADQLVVLATFTLVVVAICYALAVCGIGFGAWLVAVA